MSLYPLAFPKGVKYECELCSKPAHTQCDQCRVTYYCCKEHKQIDWSGIHEKICSNMKRLRHGMEFQPTKEARDRRQREDFAEKERLIELTSTETQSMLFERQFERAIPAAIQFLRFSIQVHGRGSVELVSPYLSLGEASLGMGKVSQAEAYLSQANWTALKAEKMSRAVTSRLYRAMGMLHASKGDNNEALRLFSEDVYHASMEFGTDDIRTSGGYFHMANVFSRQGRHDVAHSLYEQVTDMWHKTLLRIVRSWTQPAPVPRGVGPGVIDKEIVYEEGLSQAQKAEGKHVLHSLYDMALRQTQSGCQAACDVVLVTHSLAMLYFLHGDRFKAKEYGKEALLFCTKLPNSSCRSDVEAFAQLCKNNTPLRLGYVAKAPQG